ncbi:MAG TPA: translocation/assembly module TamB domain-containing protein [Candidatus Baltobacteraceae bacterium]|nr:translocation/assembly module TamB domain-containing protein [Candidatus Baltobacteraceae bacterium]
MKRRRSRGAVIGLAILIAVAAIAYAFRMPLAQFALTKGIGAATGTSVSVGHLTMHNGRAIVENVRMSARGQQLAFIPRVEVRYNLHDLLPGSQHLYGLRAMSIYHPRVTVIHNPDGTYNLPHLGKAGPSKKSAAPMNFTMRVVGGSIAVIDNTRLDPKARRLFIDRVNVSANVNTGARTHYTATMAYEDEGAAYPIDGHGTIDKAIGLNYQRWTAAHVPLPQLVNYALNNANLRLRAGYLDNVDARYYGKIAATAYLRDGRVTMQGVSDPIEHVHGPLEVTSAALTTPHIDATIAGAPIHVSGAIYDLSHPHFRMMVHAHGDVARLKKLTTAAAHLPMRGPIDMSMLVEGAVRTPLALILMHSPQIEYRAMPLRNPNGMLAFDGHTATIVNFGLQYGGFTLGARGRMALVKEHNALEAVATVHGPSDEVPYASSLFPGMTLDGAVLATADTLKRIDTHGVLNGTGPSGSLASAFSVASNGVGSVALAYGDTLYAKIALDHPHDAMDALVRANEFTIRPSTSAGLPGLAMKALPPVSGTMSGDVFASRRHNALGLRGNVALTDARYGKISIASARARFGGSPGDVRVASLDASGNFGRVHTAGTIAGTNRVALEGRYSGSLSQIAQIAGNIPAHGVVDAPIALVYNGGRSVAQVQNARFTDASIRGVPIEGLSATIGLAPLANTSGNDIRVYAAHANVAKGGTAVAQGSIGNGGRLAFAVSQFPVAGGYADAAATATGSLRAPDVNGTLLLADAQYLHYPISGASSFTYAGGNVGVRNAMIDAGPALVAADGTVWPRYDLNATASGLFSYAQFQGSVDANVHVGGSGTTPSVAGTIDVPEGNVHGLAFRDMHAAIAGTPRDIHVNNGSVTVGSTALAFDAAYAPGDVRASVDAPHADLADFNDYFDTGDTLAGRGRLALSVDMTPFTLASSGNVNLQSVRYRRFDIGRTVADWQTSGRSTSVVASVGGAHGQAHIAGTVVPSSKTLNLNANVRDLDLNNWLPLLGYTAPVTGYIDANAVLRGAYPDVAVNLDANLRDGIIGRVHVQRATVAATAQHGRGRITQAVVQIPYFTATGSGTFGLHKRDALAVAVRATSPDVGKLVETFSGKPNELAGVLNTTLHVNGTAQDPHVNDTLALTQLRYAKLTVPKVQANIAVTKQRVALTQGTIDLPKGTITASGNAPVHSSANAPISMELAANNVDLSDFGAALPQGTTVKGTLNGTLRVAGTMRAPRLDGSMALKNGYFVGPIDQNPVSDLNGTLLFRGTHIALRGVHGNVGGGTLSMDGTASVPTLRDVRAATFDSRIVANNAQVNSPKYFRGKFDANIHAYRAAGQKLATIAGNVTVPSARIPLTAFWNPHAPKTPKAPPLPLAFDLTANVGRDVRVQSPNVDVGARGKVTVTGTLAKPALDGQIASTGGTVDFFRRFQIQRANVKFDPTEGIWPYINAVATTQVSNPLTYIQLRVTGLAPNQMQLDLQSDPSYDRTQILALLSGLQNFGAVPGVASSPGNGTGGFTLGGAVQGYALGQLNDLFTRNVFEPLDVGLGSALGLENLQISDSFTSGFGVSAVKAFGKHITASFSQNLGEPKQSTLSIEAHHSDSTAFALMLYSVQDPPLTGFLSANNNPFRFNDLLNSHSTMTAVSGTNGLSLLYEHKFH